MGRIDVGLPVNPCKTRTPNGPLLTEYGSQPGMMAVVIGCKPTGDAPNDADVAVEGPIV